MNAMNDKELADFQLAEKEITGDIVIALISKLNIDSKTIKPEEQIKYVVSAYQTIFKAVDGAM
jgi:hypothetical protein